MSAACQDAAGQHFAHASMLDLRRRDGVKPSVFAAGSSGRDMSMHICVYIYAERAQAAGHRQSDECILKKCADIIVSSFIPQPTVCQL